MAKRKRTNKNVMSPSRRRAERTQTMPRKRMSGKYLTLALMGGAAVFVIRACNDTQETDDEGVYYTSTQDCVNDGNSVQLCNDAWNSANIALASEVPKDLTQAACVARYDSCYFATPSQRWMPSLSGFIVDKEAYKENVENTGSHSASTSAYSHPVWKHSREYTWHSSAKSHSRKTMTSGSGYSSKKSSTVSRGGFGHSSSSRGHWGG